MSAKRAKDGGLDGVEVCCSHGFKIRMAGAIPVFVNSRIVDPAEAERIIATGQADVTGMTRALIVDPEMPNKATQGYLETIEDCIGCLQACIGHYHKGLTIGCVQNPLAGKEAELRPLIERNRERKKVVVVGAGPAGLQAAITTDVHGHEVILVVRHHLSAACSISCEELRCEENLLTRCSTTLPAGCIKAT